MVVFWHFDRPVGHAFLDGAQDGIARSMVDPDVLSTIEREETDAGPARHTASIVICTRDRPEALRRCLATLPDQSYAAREIIVVDNGSSDERTRDVVSDAGATYVREDRHGLDCARNAGARCATSDIIVYTDDDVLLHSRWLERMVAAFDSPDISAVTGLVLPAELSTDAQWHFERHWSFGRGYTRQDFTAAAFAEQLDRAFPAWDIGAGASMAFRRHVFDRIGWFDERLDVGQAGCSGDSEYWYRLLANGYNCRYEPRAVAFHYHRRTTDGLSNQIFNYMRGHSAALMVQYERTGITANLIQALWRKPKWYLRRLVMRVRMGPSEGDRFLREEIRGYFAGLMFFWRNRNSRA